MTRKSTGLGDFRPKSQIAKPTPPSVDEWISSAAEDSGRTSVPTPASEPSQRPARSARRGPTAEELKPKKIIARTTEDFHQAVKVAATQRGMTLEQIVTLALERLLAEWDAEGVEVWEIPRTDVS